MPLQPIVHSRFDDDFDALKDSDGELDKICNGASEAKTGKITWSFNFEVPAPKKWKPDHKKEWLKVLLNNLLVETKNAWLKVDTRKYDVVTVVGSERHADEGGWFVEIAFLYPNDASDADRNGVNTYMELSRSSDEMDSKVQVKPTRNPPPEKQRITESYAELGLREKATASKSAAAYGG